MFDYLTLDTQKGDLVVVGDNVPPGSDDVLEGDLVWNIAQFLLPQDATFTGDFNGDGVTETVDLSVGVPVGSVSNGCPLGSLPDANGSCYACPASFQTTIDWNDNGTFDKAPYVDLSVYDAATCQSPDGVSDAIQLDACIEYTNEWVFNIGDLVDYLLGVESDGGYVLQVRFYPR